MSRPCHIGEWGGVDDEDVVEVLVAPIVGGHHADPVHNPADEGRVAHRVDHDLARCAIENVLGHRPPINRGGWLESRGGQCVDRVEGAVLLVIRSPCHQDSAALVVGGIDRGGAGDRSGRNAIVKASRGHNWSYDDGVCSVELPGLVDADRSEPERFAGLQLEHRRVAGPEGHIDPPAERDSAGDRLLDGPYPCSVGIVLHAGGPLKVDRAGRAS